jgi:hypothetical protein
MSNKISGEELLERHTLLEIVYLIREKGLQPYDKYGVPITHCPFPSWWVKSERADLALKTIEQKKVQLQRNRYAEIPNSELENELEKTEEKWLQVKNEVSEELATINSSGKSIHSWEFATLPPLQKQKEELESIIREAIFSRELVSSLTQRKGIDEQEESSKPKRKSRYHKEREKAREEIRIAWKEDLHRSKAWIIKNRLSKKVKRPDGKPFLEKTYRGWFKDKPGEDQLK